LETELDQGGSGRKGALTTTTSGAGRGWEVRKNTTHLRHERHDLGFLSRDLQKVPGRPVGSKDTELN